MRCINCDKETFVTISRPSKKTTSIWRRRYCPNCKIRFSSREKPDFSLTVKVNKNSGELEPFLEDKLFISIKDSLSHRKDALEASRGLTDTVCSKLFPASSLEIEAKQIYEITYKVLTRFDRAAAVYYKAHRTNFRVSRIELRGQNL